MTNLHATSPFKLHQTCVTFALFRSVLYYIVFSVQKTWLLSNYFGRENVGVLCGLCRCAVNVQGKYGYIFIQTTVKRLGSGSRRSRVKPSERALKKLTIPYSRENRHRDLCTGSFSVIDRRSLGGWAEKKTECRIMYTTATSSFLHLGYCYKRESFPRFFRTLLDEIMRRRFIHNYRRHWPLWLPAFSSHAKKKCGAQESCALIWTVVLGQTSCWRTVFHGWRQFSGPITWVNHSFLFLSR